MTSCTFPQEHTLRVNINKMQSVGLICTDAALQELLIGYLFNEGLIHSLADIQELKILEDHASAQVLLATGCRIPARTLRPSGLGGQQLDGEVSLTVRKVEKVYSLPYILHCAEVMEQQALCYAQTGGMHCSALFDTERQLALFEDIGRHNTLDKLAGDRLLRNLNTEDSLLVTTGRISMDMVHKAAKLGASVIASYSIPTQSAFWAAQEANITLIGYLKREKRMVYSVQERIRA